MGDKIRTDSIWWSQPFVVILFSSKNLINHGQKHGKAQYAAMTKTVLWYHKFIAAELICYFSQVDGYIDLLPIDCKSD